MVRPGLYQGNREYSNDAFTLSCRSSITHHHWHHGSSRSKHRYEASKTIKYQPSNTRNQCLRDDSWQCHNGRPPRSPGRPRISLEQRQQLDSWVANMVAIYRWSKLHVAWLSTCNFPLFFNMLCIAKLFLSCFSWRAIRTHSHSTSDGSAIDSKRLGQRHRWTADLPTIAAQWWNGWAPVPRIIVELRSRCGLGLDRSTHSLVLNF